MMPYTGYDAAHVLRSRASTVRADAERLSAHIEELDEEQVANRERLVAMRSGADALDAAASKLEEMA